MDLLSAPSAKRPTTGMNVAASIFVDIVKYKNTVNPVQLVVTVDGFPIPPLASLSTYTNYKALHNPLPPPISTLQSAENLAIKVCTVRYMAV